MKIFFISMLLFSISFSNQQKNIANIKIIEKQDLKIISELGIEIDHHRSLDEIHVFVNDAEFKNIKKLGYQINYIPNKAKIYYDKLLNETRDSDNPLAEYHNYNELSDFLQNIAKQYPNITNLESIGKSVQGRELWVMEIMIPCFRN